MTIADYLKYAITEGIINTRGWTISIFGIQSDGTETDYIKIDNKVGYVKVKEDWVKLDGYTYGKPFIPIATEISLKANYLRCMQNDVKTTIGKFLVNYYLLEYPFKGKVPYITGDVSLKLILKTVNEYYNKEAISVKEYKEFVSACSFLEATQKLFTPSSTYKLTVPPPGLKKFKSDLRDTFVTKYGKDWSKDPSRIVEYDTKLRVFYNDFIKDDPSYGVIANKKNRGNALSKKYLTFSATNAFGDNEHIDPALIDGYPKNPIKLAAMFNTSRSASYLRGNETQKGGSVAKSVLRATSSIKITYTDCGVTYGKLVTVTDNNKDVMIGRYQIVNKKPIEITGDVVSSLVGKTIEIRSPAYCKEEDNNRCNICSGKSLSKYPNGVALLVTDISSTLIVSALKAMHNSQLKTVKVDITTIIK